MQYNLIASTATFNSNIIMAAPGTGNNSINSGQQEAGQATDSQHGEMDIILPTQYMHDIICILSCTTCLTKESIM